MKKRILFIFNKDRANNYSNKLLHSDWANDCSNDFRVKFWGLGFGDTSLKALKNKIDSFKPDYIYCTLRGIFKSGNWLPDLTSIKVCKIFVECDTWHWPRNDPWYEQFDKVYCRQPWWGKSSQKYNKLLGSEELFNEKLRNAISWEETPLFRWSIPEKCLNKDKEAKRNGIFFIGRATMPAYESRIDMYNRFKDKIHFKPGINELKMIEGEKYWELLKSASALVCPTESAYGDFIPAKIFEYAASGAAIITNCDLDRYEMSDLNQVVIKYEDWNDLGKKLQMDFSPYYNKSVDVMKNHTHVLRYKEIFI